MAVDKEEVKNKAIKPPLRDSEGLQVVTFRDETVPEEGISLNAAAREAVEAEDEEATKRAEFEKFLAGR